MARSKAVLQPDGRESLGEGPAATAGDGTGVAVGLRWGLDRPLEAGWLAGAIGLPSGDLCYIWSRRVDKAVDSRDEVDRVTLHEHRAHLGKVTQISNARGPEPSRIGGAERCHLAVLRYPHQHMAGGVGTLGNNRGGVPAAEGSLVGGLS